MANKENTLGILSTKDPDAKRCTEVSSVHG